MAIAVATRMAAPRALMMVLALVLCALAGRAPGQVTPVLYVNGQAITRHELDQRARFLALLGGRGDTRQQAMQQLIDERLQLAAAREAGTLPGEEEIRAGMQEFAGRANLDAERFIAAIRAEGVSAQSFRDFVRAGIAWRTLVRQRFGPRARVSQSEVDRAAALARDQGGARVRLAEIILRADTPARRREAQRLAERLSREIDGEAAFSNAARRHSVSDTRTRGGTLGWIELASLPPDIAEVVLTLAPGQTSPPIELPNAVGLFQLRGIEEGAGGGAEAEAVEYARLKLAPGEDGAEALRRLRARADRCDGLYPLARERPEGSLTRETVQTESLADPLAAAIARLDAGESALVGGGNAIVMLCARTSIAAADADRGAIRQRLFGQRLTSYAESYLAQLRAEAIIRKP